MVRAFNRDFEVNGPSKVRIVRTTLAGWRRYKNHPDPRVRDRFAWEARPLSREYVALVAAARLYLRDRPAICVKLDRLLGELIREFGWTARLAAAFGGRLLDWTAPRETARLARGWTYEPSTFYEVNEAAAALPRRHRATLCRSVKCATSGATSDSAILEPAEVTAGADG